MLFACVSLFRGIFSYCYFFLHGRLYARFVHFMLLQKLLLFHYFFFFILRIYTYKFFVLSVRFAFPLSSSYSANLTCIENAHWSIFMRCICICGVCVCVCCLCTTYIVVTSRKTKMIVTKNSAHTRSDRKRIASTD